MKFSSITSVIMIIIIEFIIVADELVIKMRVIWPVWWRFTVSSCQSGSTANQFSETVTLIIINIAEICCRTPNWRNLVCFPVWIHGLW